MNKKIYITDSQCITPLAMNVSANADALQLGVSGIKRQSINGIDGDFFISKIDEILLHDTFSTEFSHSGNFSKLEKMLLLAMLPIVQKQHINSRTALILSTTKGNIGQLALRANPNEIRLSLLAEKLAHHYGFSGIPIVVSNACVSGLLAVSVAKRLINNNMYDDVCIVAGDEISPFIASGFRSFQALSEGVCRPFDADRTGVNLGEAAAAVWVSSTQTDGTNFHIAGDASANDANHISGPSRTGEGLFRSIQNAMNEANTTSSDIDYISAHGTATRYNDDMESIALARAELSQTPTNSLKGYYGHTLGASGLLETVIAMECAKRNSLVASLGYNLAGTTEPMHIIRENSHQNINCFLKTASGFGGCNTAVIFKKIIR